MQLDSTDQKVTFSYMAESGQVRNVQSLEENECPAHYYRGQSESRVIDEVEHVHDKPVSPFAPTVTQSVNQPTEGHQTIVSQKGILFDRLFAP